jgi:hypothetical protein
MKVPSVKYEVRVVQYEDGTFAVIVPDNMSVIEQLEMALQARWINTRAMQELAERLLREAQEHSLLR